MSSSSQSQPDHQPAIQDLLQFIRNKSCDSYDITNGNKNPNRGFVPRASLEEYLKKHDYYQTKEVLKALKGVLGPEHAQLNAREIADNASRVLCILIDIGRVKYLPVFMRNPHLLKLPCINPKEPPPMFPISAKDTDFFQSFYKTQWRYCAAKLYQQTRTRLLDDIILPITELIEKGQGHDAKVYRATIHPEYDFIAEPKSPNVPQCYALKTFKTKDASYEREIRAFEQVTQWNARDTVGLITFYGSFEYQETFNIILEYADGGNLRDFFQSANRPTGGEQIIDFWESMFDTIKALFSIHQHYLGSDSEGHEMHLQGWHHDLKPTNILVTSKPEARYPYRFKIADLGISQFQTVMKGEDEARGHGGFGTRTYGAPECYSWTDHTSSEPKLVRRNIDIWSLGCIFSEAAVWLVRGTSQVSNYKRLRGLSSQQLNREFRDGGCFHDGQRRLPAVDAQHNELRPYFREQHDFITGKVIDNMIVEMLDHDTEVRPSAQQLDRRAERAVNQSRVELAQDSAYASQHTPTRRQHTQAQSPESVASGILRPSEDGGNISPIYNPERGILGERDRFFRSPPATRANTEQATGYPQRILDLPANLANVELVEIHEDSEAPDRHHWTADNGHPSRPQPVPLPLQTEVDRALDGCALPQQPPQGGHSHHPSNESSAVPATPTSPPDQQQFSRGILPDCSRAEAKAWYDARKNKQLSAELPHPRLMKYLWNRDAVFVVDDSESMLEHRPDITELIRILAFITKTFDPDGVDLYYLSSEQRTKFKSSTAIANNVAHHRFAGTYGLAPTVDGLLQKYCRSIEKSKSWRSAFSSLKKRTIYVFTDGILDAGDADQGKRYLRTLVQDVLKEKLPRDQIGVQFISFGEHAGGLKRLEDLDNLARKERLGLDVCDTEPATKNVWKMLLGAINDKFDNDPTPVAGPSAMGWNPE